MPPKTWDISYPQPDAPKLSASPLETISPNPYFVQSNAEKYGYTTVGGMMGLGYVLAKNVMSKSPITARIWMYPICCALGAGVVGLYSDYKSKQWDHRDAMLRHYITLHPDDFPPYQRVKIGDLFEDWYPVR